jgi:hypothetical protein
MNTKYKAQDHLKSNLCTLDECENVNMIEFIQNEFIPRYSIPSDFIRRGRETKNGGDTGFNHERIMCTNLPLVPMIYEVKKSGVWQTFEILEGCASDFFTPEMVGQKFIVFGRNERQSEFGVLRHVRPNTDEMQTMMDENNIDAICTSVYFQKNKNF